MIEVWPAADVFASFDALEARNLRPTTTILDPWYNKGIGGIADDYDGFIEGLLHRACAVSDHVFLWGFPEILANYVRSIPRPMELLCWVTWYYKNNPSVIRGWRSGQQACLHLARPDAALYPQHFLNSLQLNKQKAGKLRYMPAPTSVIEASLIIGFVGRDENFGHPSPKPLSVYDKLIRMTTVSGDLVFDPMAGSGTSGVVCKIRDRCGILCDANSGYLDICKTRLDRDYIGWAEKLDRINNNPDKAKGDLVELEMTVPVQDECLMVP